MKNENIILFFILCMFNRQIAVVRAHENFCVLETQSERHLRTLEFRQFMDTIFTRKKFLLNFLSSRDMPEKIQKQGRDERAREDYPTSARYTADVGYFLLFSSLPCFCNILQVHPFLKPILAETFSTFCSFVQVSKSTSKRNSFRDSLCYSA